VPVDGFEQDTLVDGEHEYDVAGGDELEAVSSLSGWAWLDTCFEDLISMQWRV
jgi:hypothetical protein